MAVALGMERAVIEDWTITAFGKFDWAENKAYWTVENYDETWKHELWVQFDVEDFGKGSPLADNPDDYYGGRFYNWWYLDDKVLKECFSERDQGLISSHIDEMIDFEINHRGEDDETCQGI